MPPDISLSPKQFSNKIIHHDDATNSTIQAPADFSLSAEDFSNDDVLVSSNKSPASDFEQSPVTTERSGFQEEYDSNNYPSTTSLQKKNELQDFEHVTTERSGFQEESDSNIYTSTSIQKNNELQPSESTGNDFIISSDSSSDDEIYLNLSNEDYLVSIMIEEKNIQNNFLINFYRNYV